MKVHISDLEVGRTYLWFNYFEDWQAGTYAKGWRRVSIGWFKLIKKPENGARLNKQHVKGILLNFQFWFPILPD